MNIDELIKKCRLREEEVGDNLDLEIEATYPRSDASIIMTICVDKLLEAQLRKAIPIIQQETLKEAGYVKLAEDQSLPENEHRKKDWQDKDINIQGYYLLASNVYDQAQQDMLKAGFRKVKL